MLADVRVVDEQQARVNKSFHSLQNHVGMETAFTLLLLPNRIFYIQYLIENGEKLLKHGDNVNFKFRCATREK